MLIRIVSFVTKISNNPITLSTIDGWYPSEYFSINAYRDTNHHFRKAPLLKLPRDVVQHKFIHARCRSFFRARFTKPHLNMKYPPLWVLHTTLG